MNYNFIWKSKEERYNSCNTFFLLETRCTLQQKYKNQWLNTNHANGTASHFRCCSLTF